MAEQRQTKFWPQPSSVCSQRTSLSSSVSLFHGVAKPSKIGKDIQKEGRPFCTWLPHRPFLPRCKICKEKKTGILNSELCSKRIHFSVRKGVFLPGLCNCTAYLWFQGPLSSLQPLPQENREHTIGLIIL